MTEVVRPVRVAVVGAAEASAGELRAAEALGRGLAELGAVVVCGGLSGVMEAVARGCAEAGGTTVGVLPGHRAEEANPWVQLPLATGLGQARNVLVVGFAEAVVAVGGSWGTLSEIALARKAGTPVVLLGKPSVDGLDLPRVGNAADAAAWAVEQARARRVGQR